MSKSPFYHAFTPSVLGNRWFYFGIAAVVLVFFAGWLRYTAGRRKIYKRYSAWAVNILAGMLAVVFGVFVFTDSWKGLLQWFDNGLVGNESPVISVVLAVAAILISVSLMRGILIVFAALGGSLKRGNLKKTVMARRKAADEAVKAGSQTTENTVETAEVLSREDAKVAEASLGESAAEVIKLEIRLEMETSVELSAAEAGSIMSSTDGLPELSSGMELKVLRFSEFALKRVLARRAE